MPFSGIWYLMTLKAAFIFVAPGADPKTHRSVIITPEVELITVGVANYTMAADITQTLVSEGVQAIELCGGFGIEGTAIVKQATNGKAVVGVVRFDTHPGILNKSGDEIFSQ